jgi:hypothetical protein
VIEAAQTLKKIATEPDATDPKQRYQSKADKQCDHEAGWYHPAKIQNDRDEYDNHPKKKARVFRHHQICVLVPAIWLPKDYDWTPLHSVEKPKHPIGCHVVATQSILMIQRSKHAH